jgi:hypothetical protein
MKQTQRIIFIFLLWGIALSARAETSEVEEEPFRYNGSFKAIEVALGATTPFLGSDYGATGFQVQVSGRLATILQVLDIASAYNFHQSEVFGKKHQAHSLTADLRIHPMLVRHFSQTWSEYTLASLHLLFFVGPLLSNLEDEGLDFSAVYGLGLGIDIPLGDLDQERMWWLGLNWRLSLASAGGLELDSQSVNLSLSYRFQGL